MRRMLNRYLLGRSNGRSIGSSLNLMRNEAERGEANALNEQGEAYEPVPEDFIPSPPKPDSPFSVWPREGAGRWVVLFFFAMVLLSGASWWDLFSKVNLGHLNFSVSRDDIFTNHEYWRLLSALFLHADIVHLAHNSFTFLFFGWILNAYFGSLAFPLGSVFIGIVSNLITIYFYESDAHVLGASGMIYGMVSLWLTLYVLLDRKSTMPARVIRSVGFSLLILFPQTYEASISYMAHASGFGLGILTGLAIAPYTARKAPVFNPQKIYHVAVTTEWNNALASGAGYAPPAFENEGFIHCATRFQLSYVLHKYFFGKTDIILVELSAKALQDQLKYEGHEDKFPHVFRKIVPSDVVGTIVPDRFVGGVAVIPQRT